MRSLLRSPTFLAAAATAIAIGVGASTAVFTLVDGVLLQPLGYPRPHELVTLYAARGPGDQEPPSYLDFEDWQAQSRTMTAMAFLRGESMLLRGSDGAQRVTVAIASDGFFGVLGAKPVLGRLFASDDERPGAARVVVLGYGLWQTRFGGDPQIVGKPLATVDGVYEIIGVLPRTFGYPSWAQLYTPLTPVAGTIGALARRDFRVDHRVIARLAPGVTPAAARTEMSVIANRLAAQHAEDRGWGVTVVGLRDEAVGDVRASLVAFGAAVALLLLIACANVANLSLVRASARTREHAVRIALGASRLRLVRQAFAESATIALVGGVAGTALAWAILRAVRGFAATALPRLDEIGLDARMLAIALGVTGLTAVLVAIVPAFQASTTAPGLVLREGTAGSGLGRRGLRVRAALVVGELALALVLLVGSGLLVRSFMRLRSVDPGFETAHLLTVRIEPAEARYDSPEKLSALYATLRERVAAVPGVASVGLINHMPLSGTSVVTRLDIDGQPAPPGKEDAALYRLIDERFLDASGLRLIAGRGLTATEISGASGVALVSDNIARKYWAGRSALGQSITVTKQAGGRADFGTPVHARIVGVVADAPLADLTRPRDETIYLPFAVNPWRNAYLAIRVVGAPGAVAPAVRRALLAVEPDLPLGTLATGRALLDATLGSRPLALAVTGAFATAALALAVLGVSGVVAYGVTQRRREIGIRAALGASSSRLVRLFVAQGARLAATGAVLGLVLSLAATRLLAGLVFGVSVRDGLTLSAMAALLVGVVLVASWIPARRAALVAPVDALRDS